MCSASESISHILGVSASFIRLFLVFWKFCAIKVALPITSDLTLSIVMRRARSLIDWQRQPGDHDNIHPGRLPQRVVVLPSVPLELGAPRKQVYIDSDCYRCMVGSVCVIDMRLRSTLSLSSIQGGCRAFIALAHVFSKRVDITHSWC